MVITQQKQVIAGKLRDVESDMLKEMLHRVAMHKSLAAFEQERMAQFGRELVIRHGLDEDKHQIDLANCRDILEREVPTQVTENTEV